MHSDLYLSFLITIGVLIYYSININGCQYQYSDISNPNKIRLCVSSRWVPWLNTTIGMVHENTTIFCNPLSLVHNYFTLINLSIPSYDGIVETEIIERSCDLVISVTNGIFYHDTYNKTTARKLPLVLAYLI